MRKVGRLLWNLPDILCSILLGAITALVGGAVISRYVFFFAFTWAEELVRFLFIWLAFVGGALAVKYLTHFRLTFVRDALPPRIAHLLDIFGQLCFAALGAILLLWGGELTRLTMGQTSPALELPQGLVYASIPLSGAMILVYAILNAYWGWQGRVSLDLRHTEEG